MLRPKTPRATYKRSVSRMLLGAAAVAVFSATLTPPFASIAGASLFSLFSSRDRSMERAPARAIDNSQTITLLRAATNIDPNASRGGGDVRLVGDSALIADANPFADAPSVHREHGSADQIMRYTVQEGDTLSQVATMFDVRVSTIVWANDLASGKDIHPGQTLLILPIDGVQHTVAKNDTLASIAKKYGGDEKEILVYNGLSEGTLVVGAVLTVPGGEEPRVVKKVTENRVAHGKSGSFLNPLPGAVRTQGIHGYNAVDFGAPIGTPVRAAARGTVIVARAGAWNGGYGTYVVIDHGNGVQTLYAHLSSIAVVEGQMIAQGDSVGGVGSTGRSTGPHLHFEVRGAKNPF